jgi:hypothetical protein
LPKKNETKADNDFSLGNKLIISSHTFVGDLSTNSVPKNVEIGLIAQSKLVDLSKYEESTAGDQ